MQKMIDEFLKSVSSGNYTQAFIIITTLVIIFKSGAIKKSVIALFEYFKKKSDRMKTMKEIAHSLANHSVISGTARKKEFMLNPANLASFAQYSQGAVDWQRRKKFVQIMLSTKFDVFNKALATVVADFNTAYLSEDSAAIGRILNKDYWFNFLKVNIAKYKELTHNAGVPLEAIMVFEKYHNTAEVNLVKFTDQFIDALLVSDVETIRSILNIYDFTFSIVKSDIGDILQLNGELSSSLRSMKI